MAALSLSPGSRSFFLGKVQRFLLLRGYGLRSKVSWVAYRLRPHTLNGRRHHGHQPLCEERVGKKAVPELAHRVFRVGAKW